MKFFQILSLLFVAFPLAAQTIGPLGPKVDIATTECSYAPIILDIDDEKVVVWHDVGSIWARRGANIEELGEPVSLASGGIANLTVRAESLPGGFVVLWAGPGHLIESTIYFQRFDGALQPQNQPVEVANSSTFPDQALSVDPDGRVTVAFSDLAGTIQLHRYTPADQLLFPPVTVQSDIDGLWKVQLTRGSAGLLVSWIESLPMDSGINLRARAFSPIGVPLGGLTELGPTGPTMDALAIVPGPGGYLGVFANFDLFAFRLDENGQLTAGLQALNVAEQSSQAKMAVGPELTWIAWANGRSLFVGTLDPQTLSARSSEPVETLVSPNFLSLSNLNVDDRGLATVGWQKGRYIGIPQPCQEAESIHARSYDLIRGAVDVPTATQLGLVLKATLLALIGWGLLRRLR
jgi:hypothetical protein